MQRSIGCVLGGKHWLNAFCTSWTSGVSEFHETSLERVVPFLREARRQLVSYFEVVQSVNFQVDVESARYRYTHLRCVPMTFRALIFVTSERKVELRRFSAHDRAWLIKVRTT